MKKPTPPNIELTANKYLLLSALKHCTGIVSSRAVIPILSNVLLEARDETLTLTATNLDITISASLPAAITSPGCTTLPAKRLASIISELPQTTLELETDGKNHTYIRSGSFMSKIIGLADAEFPRPKKSKDSPAFKVAGEKLLESLKKTAFAASRDQCRAAIMGVKIIIKDSEITLVATDGRRLALTTLPLAEFADAAADGIIPIDAVRQILNILVSG
ncbi:MAG: DNA polymerase III subunit beta, partial [Aeromonas sp.]